jgi:thiol-disulfide isomerase/thioredoxin
MRRTGSGLHPARLQVAAFALYCVAAVVSSPALAAMTFSFKVPSLSGGSLSGEDFKGKIVVVDIWATWCGPCRLVIPHLVELQGKLRDRGVAVVGLNSDTDVDTAAGHKAVEKFVRDNGINYPVGLMNTAAYGEVSRVMGFNEEEGLSLPTTIILARDGTVMKRYPGYFVGQEKEIEMMISRMIEAEKPATPPARH